MTPLVSIIIPVYNVQDYIEEALHSVFSQIYKNIEIIIIDDCGQDDSIKIAKNICSEHQNFKVTFIKHECNRGLSAARNTGMKYASGDYIFFMDSDDEITPECISLHIETILRAGADFTIAGISLIGAHSVHIKPISKELELLPPQKTYFERKWSASACNKLYNRKLLSENKFFFKEGLIHEDMLWTFKMLQHTKKIGVVEDKTYLYKIRPNSITTNSNSERKIKSLVFILNEMVNDNEREDSLISFEKPFYKFLDFNRLNVALLLLNFDGNKNDAQRYYKSIQNIDKSFRCNLPNLVLRLPYPLFCLIRPLYRLYKSRS